ncbi:MAG: hypothetical protein ACRDD1_04495 [Planctomycetia bacterium]
MRRLLGSLARKRYAVVGLVVGVLLLAAFVGFFLRGGASKSAARKPTIAELEAKVEKHKQLVAAAREAQAVGKHADALRDFKESLALAAASGRKSPYLCYYWGELGGAAESAGDWTVNEDAWREAVAIASFVNGENNWRTTDNRLQLEDLLHRKSLSVEDRAALTEADRLSGEAIGPQREGNPSHQPGMPS